MSPTPIRLVLLAAALAAPPLLPALPGPHETPAPAAHAEGKKQKMIQFAVVNDTGSDVDLTVGEDKVHLAAGRSYAVRLPAGGRVVCDSETRNFKPGTVIAEASSETKGTIIHMN